MKENELKKLIKEVVNEELNASQKTDLKNELVTKITKLDNTEKSVDWLIGVFEFVINNLDEVDEYAPHLFLNAIKKEKIH